MKPRSAINLAGHKGDVVLWFGGGASGWTSSTAFGEGKNAFVESFIAKNPIARDFTTPWTKVMPEGNYLFEDDGAGEKPGDGWTATFPHPIRLDPSDKGSATRWAASPFADDYLGRFATAAIDEFKLGQTPGIDYLAVSFSMLDAVGHAFGPRSHEVQDTLVRLDKTIGDLLAALDAKVGAGRYVVALTGDHGVAPIPEQMKAMGVEAGRVDLRAVTASVEDVLVKRWGAAKDGSKYVAHVAYTDLYFAPGVVDRLKAEPATMKEVIDTMERVEGVLRVIPSHTLPEVHGTDDRLVRAARLSYMPDRSGDLFIMPKPVLADVERRHHARHRLLLRRARPGAAVRRGHQAGQILGRGEPRRSRADARRALRHHDGAPRRPRAVGSARRARDVAADADQRAALKEPPSPNPLPRGRGLNFCFPLPERELVERLHPAPSAIRALGARAAGRAAAAAYRARLSTLLETSLSRSGWH